MRFEQARDAFHHVEGFYRKLGTLYQTTSKQKTDGKEKMLLDYMAQHQMELSDNLEKYEHNAPNKILDAWFGYTDDDNVLTFPEKTELDSLDDIVAVSLECGEKLIKLFNNFADSADTSDLKEVFTNMAKMQEKEQRKLSINVDRLTEL